MIRLLVILSVLFIPFASFSQGVGNPLPVNKEQPYKLTISSLRDTVVARLDSSCMCRRYEREDSLVSITIENTGNRDLVLEDDFFVGYKGEEFTKIYFDSWYVEKDSFVWYNYHWTDICGILSNDEERAIPKIILKPGGRKVVYKNPFELYGHEDNKSHRIRANYGGISSNYLDVYFSRIDTLSGMDTKKLTVLADKNFSEGKYFEAAGMYAELWDRNKRAAIWAYKRGMCAWETNIFYNAYIWFELALEKQPKDSLYTVMRAEAMFARKEYGEAAGHYKDVLTAKGASDSLLRYATARMKLSTQKQAEADEVDPSKIEHKGWDYERAGKYDSAIIMYRRVMQLDTSAHFMWDKIAYCKQRLGLLTEALADYDTLIRKVPNYPHPHYYKALILIKQGRKAEACEELNNAYAKDEGGRFYLVENYGADMDWHREKYCK